MAINVTLDQTGQWATISIGNHQTWQGYLSELSSNMQQFIKHKMEEKL